MSSVGLPLQHRLKEMIRQEGPLPFDVFQEAALYDPEHGFYAGEHGGVRAGLAGDFVTAPTLSPVFAMAFARFVYKAWVRLGRPRDWLLVEPGGGTGGFLAGVIEELESLDPDPLRGVRAVLVDVSPAHRKQAKKRLKRLLRGARVEVVEELPVLDAPAVVIANELLDNLGVRLLWRKEGKWWERRVDWDEEAGGLGFTPVEAPGDLVQWVESFGVPVPEDHQVEVPVGTERWLAQLTDHCKAPVVMALVDYGEEARDLLGEPRPQGTVLAYEGHKRDREVLERPGMRDVTSHVNWSAVGRIARGQGWGVEAYTDQFGLLSSLGALEEAVRLAQQEASLESMQRLSALKEVMLPGGMGEAVKVLVVSRRLEGGGDGSWIGLERTRDLDPPARRA